jgi:putative chitinase
VSPDKLRAAVGCSAELAAKWADPITLACATYSIDTPDRLAAFLAQIGHESGGLRHVKEVWGPTEAQARYEGRKDLGNTQPGDGERFKGHGLIQVTGRFNHTRMRDRLRARFNGVPDFAEVPEALCEPQWAALSAADYWDDKGLNVLADAGEFERITRKINGGLNGLADRIARWERAKQALKGTDMPLAPFIAAALPSIIDAIPKLGKLFGSGSEVAERNVKAAEAVVEIVKNATGATNAQDAAERLKNDPEAAKVAAKAVEEQWFALHEVGGGIADARKADAAFVATGVNALRSPAFIISTMLLGFPLLLCVDVFYVHPDNYDGAIRTQIVTGILMVISMVGAFWLGSSFGSARKDEQREQADK